MKAFRILMASVLAAITLLCNAVAAETGKFADVDASAWYHADVQSVCGNGYMNGVGDGMFSPESTFTVAQGITVASRLSALAKGQTIDTADGGVWYTPYVDYAKEAKIITEGQFDSYNREITRAEMVELFAACLDKAHFNAINKVTDIPDVDKNEKYASDLLLLYNAGVVSGSDEYGYFHPNNSIKRSEAAAIINRTANKEARKTFTLKEAPKDLNAYYLIDDVRMLQSIRGTLCLTSSWNYENRYDASVNTSGTTTNVLKDTSKEGYVSINRNIQPTSEGVLTVVSKFSVVGTDGARMYFEDSQGKNIFELCTENGKFVVKCNGIHDTGVTAANGVYCVKAELDLDMKKSAVSINGKKVSEFDIGSIRDVSRMYYATTKEGILTFTPEFTQVFVNFLVNDTFFENTVPYEYEGEAKTKSFLSAERDIYSLELNNTGKVSRSFAKTGGRVRFESYVYMPQNADSAYVSLDNGQSSAARVDISGSTMKAGNISHTFKNNIWQRIVIEADTATGKATLNINGKNKGTFDFKADSFDGITLGFDKKSAGSVYFDDIKVSRVSDYIDYCPKPLKAESKDYVVVMSVCSLWREGSHAGWDFVSPYDECSPVWGYYDEGNPEEMDWEIKYMAEHGIDAMQFCWYVSNTQDFNIPEKQPRLVWALNDGYMNAKYSDMVDFAILWEAANFDGKKITLEQFKTFIWDYWVEWYFRDSRYLTINNKPVLQIYRPECFISAIGGEAAAKQAVDFMRTDIKNYGYDGLILLASEDGSDTKFAETLVNVGFEGMGPYCWDNGAYDPDHVNALNDRGIANTAKYPNFSFMPTISTGINIMGWENVRTPLATPEQHQKAIEYAKQLVEKQGETKGRDWQDKLIYLGNWNEYAEGHWLAPSGLNGFGYVDVYRKAFTAAKQEHYDAVPTLKQRYRISRLHNDLRQPIRPLLLEDYTVEGSAEVVESYVFASQKDRAGWTGSQVEGLTVKDGALYGKGKNKDPKVYSPENLTIDAKTVTTIKIKLKVDTIGKLQLFFVTDKDKAWDEKKSFDYTVQKAGEFTEIEINTSQNSAWADTVTRLRLDPMTNPGEFAIEYIQLYGVSEALFEASPEVTVDTVALKLPEKYIEVTDKEFYVAGDPSRGVMSANNFYYEWNRHKGTLLVKTQSETLFNFTVGSDKAKVNGKEMALEKQFCTFDGVPMLPMRFIMDNAGIKYELKGKKLFITHRDIDFAAAEGQRVPYEYEFNLVDDSEGWNVSCGVGYVDNGSYTITATEVTAVSTGYDLKIIKQGLDISAAKYKKIAVRMKYESLPNKTSEVDDKLGFYFGTNLDSKLDEVKTSKMLLADGVDDGDGYKVYTFDMSKNEKWKGTVQLLRFDPSNNNGVYTIDYIRVVE